MFGSRCFGLNGCARWICWEIADYTDTTLHELDIGRWHLSLFDKGHIVVFLLNHAQSPCAPSAELLGTNSLQGCLGKGLGKFGDER